MLSAEIAAYLDDLELGGAFFVERLPETPDAAVGIYTRQGAAPDTTVGLERHAIQLIVRGAGQDPTDGNTVALEIYNTLHGLRPNAALGDGETIIRQIMANHVPAHIGRDSKGRHEWSINFTVWVYNPERQL